MTLIAVADCSCWTQAWSSECRPAHWMILFLMTLIVVVVRSCWSSECRPGHWTFLSLMTLILGSVCSCWTEAWSSECKPGAPLTTVGLWLESRKPGWQAWSWDDFIFNDFDRCGASVLVGRKRGRRNAGLVIGLFYL